MICGRGGGFILAFRDAVRAPHEAVVNSQRPEGPADPQDLHSLVAPLHLPATPPHAGIFYFDFPEFVDYMHTVTSCRHRTGVRGKTGGARGRKFDVR